MSIVVENSDSISSASSVSSLTILNFTTTGSDRLLAVCVAIESGSTDTGSVVRGGSENASQQAHADDTAGEDASIWTYVAPATSAANVVVTLAAGKSKAFGVIALALSGVHQTTPVASPQTTFGTGTSASVTVTTASGDVALDSLGVFPDATSVTVGADQTVEGSEDGGLHTRASSEPHSDGTATMSWSWTGSNDYALAAVALKVAAGGTNYTKSVAGSQAFAGVLVRKDLKVLSAAVTFSGALVAIRVFHEALAGAVTFVGGLATRKLKAFSAFAAVAFVGGLVRSTIRSFAGSVTFLGSLSRFTSRFLSGVINFVGVLIRKVLRFLDGDLSIFGELAKKSFLVRVGVVSFVGVLVAIRFFFQSVFGAVSFLGSVVTAVGSWEPFRKLIDLLHHTREEDSAG